MSSETTTDGPAPPALERELKQLLVATLRLSDVDPDSIPSDGPLFGDGLGLDSVDALQLTVAIDRVYGVRLSSDTTDAAAVGVPSVFGSVQALAAFVARSRLR
jgi:acyl carrier protein